METDGVGLGVIHDRRYGGRGYRTFQLKHSKNCLGHSYTVIHATHISAFVIAEGGVGETEGRTGD